MSIQSEINRIRSNLAAAYVKVTEKGGTVPASKVSANLASAIDTIPAGGVPEGAYTITLETSPPEGGTAAGGGIASEGMTVTVSASAVGEYNFTGWKEDGEVVSLDKLYTFPVSGDRTLAASFIVYVAGRDWWEGTLPVKVTNLYKIIYCGGKFFAVGASTTKYAYSTDGVNWTEGTFPGGVNWFNIAYGNGKFVATAQIGYQVTRIYYSTDGISWTDTGLNPSYDWNGVAYGNGKFVAIAFGEGNKGAYSTNGINWTVTTLPSYGYWRYLYYVNGKFVAISSTSTDKYTYSTDGVNWTEGTFPYAAGRSSIAYGNGKFVAVSYDNKNKAVYSTDGINWAETTLPVSGAFISVTYGDGKFVAVETNSNTAVYSVDGINWIAAALPSVSGRNYVEYGNDRFITAATSTNKFAYSRAKGPVG